MRLRTLLLVALLALPLPKLHADEPRGADIEFATKLIDLGTLSTEDDVQVVRLAFTNTGDLPLVVTEVHTSCSCTTAEYDRRSRVMPGERGSITVRMDPRSAPTGSFYRVIAVYSTALSGTQHITLKAEIDEARSERSNQTEGLAEVIQTVTPPALFGPMVGTSSEQVLVVHDEPPLEIILEEESDDETPHRPQQQSAPTDQRRDLAPAQVEARSETSNQTEGAAEVTQTVNPPALFGPVVGTSSEQVPVGNRLAPDGAEESHRGEGWGYNLQGTEGTVVVYVTIDSEGNVTNAEVDLSGTTTSDATLHRLAIEAALRAKFRPSSCTEQGGRITYNFRLH